MRPCLASSMLKTRGEFLRDGIMAGCGLAVSGCLSSSRRAAPCLTGDLAWGILLHLSTNMWGDWTPDGVYPKSLEDELRMIREGKLTFDCSRNCYRDYFSTDWDCWRDETECARRAGLNMVLIDLGNAYRFPSHPELGVNGSLDEAALRRELARIRGLGLEPVPKLNFSAGHDQWLREYHCMTSSRKYYEVVSDLIRDVCEAFDYPRYFHLGFDEEIYAACGGRRHCVMRTGSAWWKDLKFAVTEAERQGAQAMVWSDKICTGRVEFFRNMPKSVLQVPWYYGNDFSAANLTWKPELERDTGWDSHKNLAAALVELSSRGYDIMPCTSNWSTDDAAEKMLKFCRANLDPSRVKGYLTTSWLRSSPEDHHRVCDAIRLLGDAKSDV